MPSPGIRPAAAHKFLNLKSGMVEIVFLKKLVENSPKIMQRILAVFRSIWEEFSILDSSSLYEGVAESEASY